MMEATSKSLKSSVGRIMKQLSPLQVMTALLSVLGITSLFYMLSSDLAVDLEKDLRRAFDQQNVTVVDIASSRVGFHIDNDVVENVRLLGQFPAMQRQELHNGTRDMEKVHHVAAPRVDGFVLFNANGDFFTSSPESMKYRYQGNHAEDAYFKQPKETASLYFSDWIHEGDKLKMLVSAPVFNRIVDVNFPPPDGTLSGVIMTQIDFDRTIASELGRLKANGLMHWIVDESTGEVLYHSVLPRQMPENAVDSDVTQLAKDLLHAFPSTVLESGVHRAMVDGKRFTIASARSTVGPHNIIVNMAYDDSQVSTLVHEKTNRIYLLGLAFIVVMTVGVMISLRQMARRQALVSEKDHLSRELELEEEKKKLSEQVFQLQKMESLGELAAGTAHELNNALSSPMGMLSLLKMRPDMDVKKREDMLNKAIAGMEQARSIVEGLLRFSRSERNEKSLGDVNDSIRFAVQMYQKELDYAGVQCQLHLQHDLPQTMASFRQIQQIILNLMTNARYVLPKGGVLEIQSWEEMRKGEQGISVQVKDNGPGMEEDVKQRIFEPFFSTKPVGEGTGLGLSICYGIMQEYGGDLSVETKLGEGSTFTLWLPIRSES